MIFFCDPGRLSWLPGCIRSRLIIGGAVGDFGGGQPGRVSVESSAKIKKKFGETPHGVDLVEQILIFYTLLLSRASSKRS